MAWKKSPDWLIESFDGLVPDDDPRVERRKMFGYPCAFASDNMFIGLHEDRLVLRLPEEARNEFRERYGATKFEPFEGREMKEYSVVPRKLIEDPAELVPWIRRSADYAASVPRKKKKKGG
jgi:TfoX/Sxy family transcriptional regulator of competence genes